MNTFDSALVSDLHKDAYGFRPSASWMSDWNYVSDADKQHSWDALVATCEDNVARARTHQLAYVAEWNATISAMWVAGAQSHYQAEEWALDQAMDKADLTFGDPQWAGFLCFHLGLTYDYESRFSAIGARITK